MTILTPIWLQAGTYPAREDRQLISAIWPKEGVVDNASFAVTQTASPTYAVNVAPGRAVVAGDNEPRQGSYLVTSDAIATVVWPAPPGSGSRIDVLVLRVNDPNAGGPVGDNAVLAVIQGVASQTPVAPAVPDTALPLARVTVAAAQTVISTANIVNLRGAAGTQPRVTFADYDTGPRTGNGLVLDLASGGLPVAQVTGQAQLTFNGQIGFSNSSQDYSLFFEVPAAPVNGGSGQKIMTAQGVSMTQAGDWRPLQTVVLWTPITAGVQPSMTVKVFLGVPSANFYLTGRIHCVEYSTA